jgi:hypothetical protein
MRFRLLDLELRTRVVAKCSILKELPESNSVRTAAARLPFVEILGLASKCTSDTDIAIAAIAPAENAEISRTNPNATTTVSRLIPTNAKHIALLRVIVKIIRPAVSLWAVPS